MANFKQDILNATSGEAIECVVIKSLINSWYNKNDPRDSNIPVGQSIKWNIAGPLLNYSYDSGFGSMDCHDIIVYTNESVYYIHEYDGSTSIQSVPRNPPKSL